MLVIIPVNENLKAWFWDHYRTKKCSVCQNLENWPKKRNLDIRISISIHQMKSIKNSHAFKFRGLSLETYKSEEIKSLGCPSSSSMLCNVCSCCKIFLLILNFMHFLKYFNFPALQYFVHHTTEEKRERSRKLCQSRGGRLIWKTKC